MLREIAARRLATVHGGARAGAGERRDVRRLRRVLGRRSSHYWLARPVTADASLRPVFRTPPFPSYPSGPLHDLERRGRGVRRCSSRTSRPVLSRPRDRGVALARVRRVHFRFDVEAGDQLGARVGRAVVARGTGGPMARSRDRAGSSRTRQCRARYDGSVRPEALSTVEVVDVSFAWPRARYVRVRYPGPCCRARSRRGAQAQGHGDRARPRTRTPRPRRSTRRRSGARHAARSSAPMRRADYRHRALPPGTYTVRAQQLGYALVSRAGHLSGTDTATADFRCGRRRCRSTRVVVTGTAAESRKKEVGNATAGLGTKEIEAPPSATRRSSSRAARPASPCSRTPDSPAPAARSSCAAPTASRRATTRSSTSTASASTATPRRSRPARARRPPAFNDIKAEDIERVEVVKGAAATTLYGTEASGGVIQIFTKKGTTRRPSGR